MSIKNFNEIVLHNYGGIDLKAENKMNCPYCGMPINGDSCFKCGTLFTFISSNQSVVDYEHYYALNGETEMCNSFARYLELEKQNSEFITMEET